ncbi:MAG TPA: hypothetical protein VK859_05290, partial [bacterium]|nr:hypothetical protein [bacterium]
ILGSLKVFGMKKIISWVFFFLWGSTVYAATDQAAIDFLNKLDGHYYCLAREGLLDFQCEVKCSLLEDYKVKCLKAFPPGDKRTQAIVPIKMVLTCSTNGKLSFDVTNFDPNGDGILEENVGKILEVVKGAFNENIEPWRSSILEPPFGGDDFVKFDLQIKKNSDGFEVFSTGDQPVTEYVDKQWRIFEIQAGSLTAIQDCKFVYTDSPQGMLLSEVDTRLPQKAIQEKVWMEYQTMDGLVMPKKMTVHVAATGNGGDSPFDVVFEFQNYQIDKSPEETK